MKGRRWRGRVLESKLGRRRSPCEDGSGTGCSGLEAGRLNGGGKNAAAKEFDARDESPKSKVADAVADGPATGGRGAESGTDEMLAINRSQSSS